MRVLDIIKMSCERYQNFIEEKNRKPEYGWKR